MYFFILNNILALCCKTGGKLRKKMKNCPKMPFFASKYFFLLDGSRLFFKLYMVWNMHSIQHEQYKMSLNYHHLAKCSFSSFKLAKMAKFDFLIFSKKKMRGFWDPHNSPKNPQMSFFIHSSESIFYSLSYCTVVNTS